MSAAVFPLSLPGPESPLLLRPPHRDAEISQDAVRAQLTNILNSQGFVRAPRMQRFLCFIVEETLGGRSGQLCEYSIGFAVYGKNESFEPSIDPIVRNEARRLRLKLLEYYKGSAHSNGNEVTIDIPKRSYVPVFKRTPKSSRSRQEFRLTVTLTRISDGVEIWSTHHDY